tara:strand:- start:8 stop:382 length:375 start_codon:yes stop_codon:yes gene_type:complete
MKKRTALIGAILSLIPISQPLLFKTGVALSSFAVILFVPEKANADSYQKYVDLAVKEGNQKNWYEMIFYLTKAIEIRPYDGYAHWGRGTAKNVVGDRNGACSDYRKAVSFGEERAIKLVTKYKC